MIIMRKGVIVQQNSCIGIHSTMHLLQAVCILCGTATVYVKWPRVMHSVYQAPSQEPRYMTRTRTRVQKVCFAHDGKCMVAERHSYKQKNVAQQVIWPHM